MSHLYAQLFYAENGMEVGQHFMLDGVEYVRVVPVVEMGGVFFSAHRWYENDLRSIWERTYIFPSDYGRIKPIPMEK